MLRAFGQPGILPKLQRAGDLALDLQGPVNFRIAGRDRRVEPVLIRRSRLRCLVQQVARVYNGLSPEERLHAAIFGNSWGEAAAIDFYGPRYGLPAAISNHNNYWYWGCETTQEML